MDITDQSLTLELSSTVSVPRTRTILGDRSFAVAGPRVWNSLAYNTDHQLQTV